MAEVPARTAPLERHQMVRVDPAAWAAMLAARPELGSAPLLVDWACRGWPLVGRRPDGHVEAMPHADLVPLGLPLPPAQGRARLALRLPASALVDRRPPPPLSAARAAAPGTWSATIDALVQLDPEVRCYGSLAWQHLTGLPYLSETSDLDLLWSVRTRTEADARADALALIETKAPVRLDGELVAPDGVAVQWREWRSPATELLTKSMAGARLATREAWLP
jgi:phosphoribosyl-dephospho-CoA transferase